MLRCRLKNVQSIWRQSVSESHDLTLIAFIGTYKSFEWASNFFLNFLYSPFVTNPFCTLLFLFFFLYRFRSVFILKAVWSSKVVTWKLAYFVECTIWFGDLIVTYNQSGNDMHTLKMLSTGVYTFYNERSFDHRLILQARTSFSLLIYHSLFFKSLFFYIQSLISAFNRANCLVNCLSAVTTTEHIDDGSEHKKNRQLLIYIVAIDTYTQFRATVRWVRSY